MKILAYIHIKFMGITQNADQQCVMHSWSDKAYVSNGGTYFSLRNEWDTIKTKYGYSDGDMFKLFIEAFLGDGINGKKLFQFSHDPINDTGAIGQEFEYLLENNYRWNDETMTMKPRY